MAAKAKPLPENIDKVRIPGKLLTQLFHFYDSLRQRILREAATRAFARKKGPDAGRVNVADIVHAAQSILPPTSTELAESLQSGVTSHARKKAS